MLPGMKTPSLSPGRPRKGELILPVGRRLRALRDYQGRKQAELQDLCGVTPGTYSGWETGRAYPTLEQLVTLKRALGTTTDVLLGEEDLVLGDAPAEARPARRNGWHETKPGYWEHTDHAVVVERASDRPISNDAEPQYNGWEVESSKPEGFYTDLRRAKQAASMIGRWYPRQPEQSLVLPDFGNGPPDPSLKK